ncbi:MAG: hypothetical protein Kow009_07860 [Spirochaetales bacterium]
MCPERELLSSYVDEELPESTMRTLASHLSECPVCRRIVSQYRKVREILSDESVQPDLKECDIQASQQRIAIELERYRRVPHPFWSRKVQVGWAALAASIALVLGGILSFALLRPRSNDAVSYLESHPSLDITINVKNMKQLLEILRSQQGIREITIQLPEQPQFEFRSEPVFIRAADYNRSMFR